MAAWPLLRLLIWRPMAGGFATVWFGRGRADQACWFALLVAVVTLVLSTCLYTGFDPASASMQFAETREWIPSYDIWYSLGVDGISIALILLTTLVTVLVLIGAWTALDKKVPQYLASFLILEGLMLGVFSARDAIVFYAFFEAMLIPMFIIIGVWGGPRRVYAAVKFFLYTRSEEHTSELQSLMRISYAVFCLKNKSKLSMIRN